MILVFTDSLMKSRISKKNKSGKAVRKTEADLLVEHLEKDLDTELHKIKWFSKEISEAKAKVAQTRKVLEKLKKLK